MFDKTLYPGLSHLIAAYFNEDFDIWCYNIYEIFSCYKAESDEECWREIVAEIERFKCEHAGNLDGDFEELYGLYVDPAPWGHTTTSFLNELKRLLSE